MHREDDVTWVVHCGSAWRNSAILVRFAPLTGARRVHALVARYERHRRGAGFWVSPLSTPDNLPEWLASHGLRCRKHFPAMIRTLDVPLRQAPATGAIEIVPLEPDLGSRSTLKPVTDALGSTTTARRRCEVARLRVLLADPARRTRVFVARHQGAEVGQVELFVGARCSGIHGISVQEPWQGRGIGSALLERACREAALAGSPSVVLLATSQGQRLYERRGFLEIARFDYWYRSFQRSPR